MQLVERHGGGSHYVRPDRVYRTGVLTSTMGYDPGADVRSVAASFTQYPIDLRTSGLQGLGASVGLIDKLRIKFATWKARRAARAGMRGFGRAAEAHEMQRMVGNVAYARVGEDIAPHMISKEQMLTHLLKGNLPQNYARAQAETSWQGWSNRWWNAR